MNKLTSTKNRVFILLDGPSSRTDDRLRYCTNNGSVPSKFYIPERLKHLRTLKMNTQNLSTLQVFELLSRKCKSHFHQSCPKEFIPVFMRIHSKSTQKKLANHKKT